jgi:hypothetical protein
MSTLRTPTRKQTSIHITVMRKAAFEISAACNLQLDGCFNIYRSDPWGGLYIVSM